MKGFSTKYALSAGIKAVRVTKNPGYKYLYTTDRISTQLVQGKTFFQSLDDAKASVRGAAARKIVGLEKQIRKLRELIDEPKVQP